jgi:hypothetical protein
MVARMVLGGTRRGDRVRARPCGHSVSGDCLVGLLVDMRGWRGPRAVSARRSWGASGAIFLNT